MKKMPPSPEGQVRRMKDIRGKWVVFTRGKNVRMRESTNPNKFSIIEEIIYTNGNKEIRFGYYMVIQKKSRNGKWVWAQYAPILPKNDMKRLLVMAKKAKII